jgi:ATP-dependent Clp protease ATP-binding subunit ClpA
MASDIPLEVSISPTLASMAKRFDIDLSAFADEVLGERILRDPVSALTPRMRVVLLAAKELASEFGHNHIGTEHVFLAILLDPHSLPSQLMRDAGTSKVIVEQIRTMLASESYNRRNEPKGESTNVP